MLPWTVTCACTIWDGTTDRMHGHHRQCMLHSCAGVLLRKSALLSVFHTSCTSSLFGWRALLFWRAQPSILVHPKLLILAELLAFDIGHGRLMWLTSVIVFRSRYKWPESWLKGCRALPIGPCRGGGGSQQHAITCAQKQMEMCLLHRISPHSLGVSWLPVHSPA